MGKRASGLTLSDAIAHSQKHGYKLKNVPVGGERINSLQGGSEPKNKALALPAGPRMTVPEREYALILEAMKRREEILEYRPWGIKLAWGADPKTGKVMVYSPDFYVVRSAFRRNPYISDIVLIEIKGSKLFHPALVRFRGCRAAWPMFNFELHQREKDGRWRRVE